MPRKTRRPAEFRVPVGSHQPASLWPRFVATALIFTLLGAGIMYALLRPALRRSVTRPAPAVITPTTPDPAPPADLTQGLPPAEASVRLGDWYEDHSQWTQSIAAFQQALALGVTSPDVRTDLGVAYYKGGQPQAALSQYQLAQASNPNHENSLFNQGSVYVALGDTSRAITVWQTYSKRFPHGQHVQDARALITQVRAHGSPLPTPAP